MRFTPLSHRSLNVLNIIIQTFMTTAEPVGSKTVSGKSFEDLSPATIRNVMSGLEEMGLIFQPHTSAGRIPTDLGYRLYVDTIATFPPLIKQEKEQIEQAFELCLENAGLIDYYELATKLLSSLCRHAGMILLPSLSTVFIERIELIRLKPESILVIFITRSDSVHNKIVTLDEDIAQDRLDAMARYLNEEFVGLTIRKIRQKILEKMNREKEEYDSILKKALEVSRKALEEDENESELVLGGTLNIFDYPELVNDVQKMRNIFKAIEEKNELIDILDNCLKEEDTHIIIGSESHVIDMEDFSFVAHSYKSGENALGALGVFGPKRMEYPRVIAIVNHVAEAMSRALTTAS